MILFEHIPKTGGVSLRRLLIKVYGQDHNFVINSRDIKGSLAEFAALKSAERKKIKVLSGHAATLFEEHVENPFRITIIREPVSLFLSQYHYLVRFKEAVYNHDMQHVNTLDEYIDFALKHGHDNLLTRYLSNSMQWLADNKQSIPALDALGEQLLSTAIQRLHHFDAALHLSSFDDGVFALARMLNWKKFIPLYKPGNRNLKKQKNLLLDKKMAGRINELLRFDIRLYNYFIENKMDVAGKAQKKWPVYHFFIIRQAFAGCVGKLTEKAKYLHLSIKPCFLK
jgi:hypothetical protein